MLARLSRRPFYFLFFALLIGAGPALALPTASTTAENQVGLRELIRLALKRSPNINKSEAELQKSRSETAEARAALYPSLNLKGTVTSRDNPAGTSSTAASSLTGTTEDYQAYVDAQQPLLAGGLISGLQLKKQQENISRLNLLNQQQQTIAQVAQAYFEIGESQRLLTAAQKHQVILKNYANTIRRYTQIGRARKTDRLQAEVNLMTAETEVKDLEAAHLEKQEGLRKILAIEDLPPLAPIADLEDIKYEKVNMAQAIQKSLQSHPEVLISQIELEKVKNEKAVALSKDMPSLTLKGQAGYRASNRPELFENTSEYSQVSLELQVPIFSGLSSMDKRRQYEQQKVVGTRNLENKKISIETDLKTKIFQLETSLERLQLSRRAYLDAQKALDLADKDYQQGLISSQDLINVQRARYEAEKLYVRTEYNYLKTLLQARRLMGIDLEGVYAQ